MYGLPTREILISIFTIRPIIFNYRMMRLRAECGFLPKDISKKIGW
jgi:hypothetical protein